MHLHRGREGGEPVPQPQEESSLLFAVRFSDSPSERGVVGDRYRRDDGDAGNGAHRVASSSAWARATIAATTSATAMPMVHHGSRMAHAMRRAIPRTRMAAAKRTMMILSLI